MSSQTRDTLALFTLAALAVLGVLYADADLPGLFMSILARL